MVFGAGWYVIMIYYMYTIHAIIITWYHVVEQRIMSKDSPDACYILLSGQALDSV